MAGRYFTAEEANEILEVVRPLAEEDRAAARLRRAARARGRVHGNGRRQRRRFDPGELRELYDRLGEEATAVARCVAGDEVGALVKDLDRGLIDFPAQRAGEEVLLCWHVGEADIEYWHGPDEGFSGRKPLPL